MTSSRNPFAVVARALSFFLAEDRRRYLIHMPTVLVSESFELLPPFLAGIMISTLLDYHPERDFTRLVLVVLALASARGLIAWVRLRSKRVLGQIALNCRYRARVWGFERLVGFSMAWHHEEAAGNKVQRLMTGSDAIKEWGNFHNELAAPLAALIGVTVSCAWISPWFILFGVYFVGVMVLIERAYDRRIAALSVNINSSVESASGTLVEGANAILTVKAAGAGGMVRNAVEKKEAASVNLGHQRVTLSTQKWLAFQVHTCVAFGMFLTVVCYATLHKMIAVGFVITYVQYFNWMRASTTTFTDRFQTMVERYADLMRMLPLFDDGHASESTARTTAFPKDWQTLVADGLHYDWNGKPALRGVSFALARGERIGITGKSGSGKSTLIKLLLGLYHPASGAVRYGAAAAHTVVPDDMERNVAVVLQDTELFNVSLKENITLMRDLDADRYRAVCQAADLDALLARLPQGDATILGDRGMSLSGGERQRVGVARALYRNPSLLILDEATSALDDATEDAVMQGVLACVGEDCLVVAIAHRHRSLRAMDRILHIEDGRLVGERPAADALATA